MAESTASVAAEIGSDNGKSVAWMLFGAAIWVLDAAGAVVNALVGFLVSTAILYHSFCAPHPDHWKTGELSVATLTAAPITVFWASSVAI
jgi:hypothetical protein